jgi:predicted MPP superfamily phosphohydrolase
MQWLLFNTAGILIYLGCCTYIGIKLYALISYYSQKFKQLKKIFFWIPYALLCCLIVIYDLLAVNSHIWRQAGMIWLLSCIYLAAFFLLTDLIRLILFLCKRRIEGINAYLTAEALFLCTLLVVFGVLNARTIRTTHYDITLKGEGERLRIALISDMHIGVSIGESWVARYAAALNKTKPDIVCLAGDIFERHISSNNETDEVVALLKTINAPMGVYACFGNHDRDRMGSGSISTAWAALTLKPTDIIILDDEVYEVRENLFIAGRKDAQQRTRKTPDSLLAGIDGTIIVLDHQPKEFAQLDKAGADLILSGHSHKGQVFPANIAARYEYEKFGTTHYGYWKGNKAQAIVTSGAGYWGPPMRIGTKSEIAVINVHFVQ